MNERISITITTEYMFRQFATNAIELSISGTPASEAFDHEVLTALQEGNMEGIRQAFIDGHVMNLLHPDQFNRVQSVIDGKEDKDLADEVEIRVFHKGHIIGVVIDKDINY